MINILNKTPRFVQYTGQNGFELDHVLAQSYNLVAGDKVWLEAIEISDWSSRIKITGAKRMINTAVFEEINTQ